MKYIPVRGQKKYCNMIRDISGANDKDKEVPDYVEATVYNKEEAVIMVGNFADVKTPEQVSISLSLFFQKLIRCQIIES